MLLLADLRTGRGASGPDLPEVTAEPSGGCGGVGADGVSLLGGLPLPALNMSEDPQPSLPTACGDPRP